jgi:hypothetical protein
MGAFRVAGAVVGVFPVFETSLVCRAVSAEASLRCFFEGGGERLAGMEILSSGGSSRARLRSWLGIAAVDLVVEKESTLNTRLVDIGTGEDLEL